MVQKDEVMREVEDTRVMEMFELCLPKIPHRVMIPGHDFSRVSLSRRVEVKGLNQVSSLGYLDGEFWDDMMDFLSFEHCSAFHGVERDGSDMNDVSAIRQN